MRTLFSLALATCLAAVAAYAGVPAGPSRTYTTTEDFNTGQYTGTNSTVTPNQLQLDENAVAFDFAWIANSGDSLLIKVDTRTGKAVGGYLTGAPRTPGALTDSDFSCGFGGNTSPARTSVDADGNCWVANRQFGAQGSITQIAPEGGQDRNGNGVIDTSSDIDGDGIINPAVPGEVLPWGEDERVLRHYKIGGGDGLPRAITIGADGNVLVGLYNERRVVRVAPDLAAPPPAGIVAPELNSWPVPQTPYGFASTPDGRLYMATLGSAITELDLGTGATRTFPVSGTVYGIGADRNGVVWGALLGTPATVARIEPSVVPVITLHQAPGTDSGRSIAVDSDGNVWMGCSNFNTGVGSGAKFQPDGTFVASYPSDGQTGLGTAIAPNGNVLVVNQDSLTVAEINKTTGALVQLMTTCTGPSPCNYTYSDFTGSARSGSVERLGRWTAIHDGGSPGAPWTMVSWTSQEPQGTAVSVELRASDTQAGLDAVNYQAIGNNVPITGISGQFVQVRVTLSSTRVAEQITPILLDLTLGGGGNARVAVTPSPVRYPLTKVGGESQRDVLIRNVGTSPVSIAVVRATSYFSVRPVEFTLAAGARRRVQVAFRPLKECTSRGNLILRTSAPGQGAIRVPLIGPACKKFRL